MTELRFQGRKTEALGGVGESSKPKSPEMSKRIVTNLPMEKAQELEGMPKNDPRRKGLEDDLRKAGVEIDSDHPEEILANTAKMVSAEYEEHTQMLKAAAQQEAEKRASLESDIQKTSPDTVVQRRAHDPKRDVGLHKVVNLDEYKAMQAAKQSAAKPKSLLQRGLNALGF